MTGVLEKHPLECLPRVNGQQHHLQLEAQPSSGLSPSPGADTLYSLQVLLLLPRVLSP